MNPQAKTTAGSAIRLSGLLLFLSCVGLFAAGARADFVTDSFGIKGCSKPGTMTAARAEGVGMVLKFDLSALPKRAKVHRAILKMSCRRRDYRRAVLLYPLTAGKDGQPARTKNPLPLRGPFFQDFDATDLVRAWVKDPKANLGLAVVSAPGWDQDATAMLVSYDGRGRPTPAATGLAAAFVNGQVFLRFKEIADIIGAEKIKFEDFEAKALAARAKENIYYRIYRSAKPITAANLGDAELVRELEATLPAYNLDAVPTVEHAHPPHSRPSKLIGSKRVQAAIVRRFRVPMQKQLVSGENLAVMTARKTGTFYYAVTAVINGYEAVAKLGPGNSLAAPVAETVEAVGPVLQSTSVRKRGRSEEVIERYVCFYEPPYWPTPLRVEMCSAYDKKRLAEKAVPLEMCLGTYGGQSPYNLGRRHVPGAYYVSPPVMTAMGQGIHECIGTLKSYDQGIVRNYAHKQVIALTVWARKKWPNIDAGRVCVNGQFAIWALRHPEVFAVVTADPYGNFAAGKEMVRHGHSWGPFPAGSKNEDGGVDQWDYLNVAKWIRENPKVELPFYCGKASSASHVGDMGFMPAPEVYRALLDTKRAFAAHFGPSQGFGGPPPAAGLPIRRDQALPAFSHCSLDDMVGDGDQWGGAAGGTIGSGDPWGRFNADLRWDFGSIVDEPKRFAVTVWLTAGARQADCTADLTPRRCQAFKAAAGAKFKWTAAVVPAAAPAKGAKAPKPAAVPAAKYAQSGQTAADKSGLVTIPKLRIPKARLRVTLSAE